MSDDDPFALLRDLWSEPPAVTRPRTRWWWFGPDVDRGELARELDAMAAAGFGGAEVATVYPLSERPDSFGSPTFLADLRFAAEHARSIGLSFDVTLGSGWSYGGPHVTPEHAARCLQWDERLIGGDGEEIAVAPAWPGDELVAAFVARGADLETNPSFEALPISAEGTVTIPVGAGPRRVLVATSRLTGQQVKRAARGAEGPVLDHYSAAAVKAHIAAVAEPIVEAVGIELLGSVFCDSLEVYRSDWTSTLPAEFERRRGYDPLPRLYLLAAEGSGFAAFRADYYRTLTELYEDNFVAVMGDWARERGVPFRIQSYGEPPGTVSSYRHADAFEGEGWGWKGLPQTRWASAAGHLYGKDIVSSEVWTWTHSPSLRATPLDLKGEAHDHFLCGINQLYSHGWPYTAPHAPGIGWLFYAAGAIDDRNPWWAAMPSLSRYLQRLSWLLRQGTPVVDVGVYVPAREAYARMGTFPEFRPHGEDLWRRTRELLDGIPAAIRGSGFDFDCVDDDALSGLPPDRYPVIVLPGVGSLPEATAAWIRSARQAGVKVLGVGAAVADVDADAWLGTEGLGVALADVITPDAVATPAEAELGVTHRRVRAVDAYFVANTGPRPLRTQLGLRTPAAVYEQWRPEDGGVVRRGQTSDGIPVELAPYQATVVVTAAAGVPGVEAEAAQERDGRLPLLHWTLDDGSGRMVTVPHVWQSDPDVAPDRLTLRYSCTFDHPLAATFGSVTLDFGACQPDEPGDFDITALRPQSFRARLRPPVGEVAQVWVNGAAAGVVWAPPYELDLTPHLRSGSNDLVVEVATVGARALATDPSIAETVETSLRRYGRRFTMQDVDLATVDLRSGLLGVPALVTRFSSPG
jgi:hypothetical protein